MIRTPEVGSEPEPVQGASVEDCRQAYDRIVKAPENSGYSDKCLENRRKLLVTVADTLLDTSSRSAYELQHAEVEHASLPGAIALLQVRKHRGHHVVRHQLEHHHECKI